MVYNSEREKFMKCNICEIGCMLKDGATGKCGMYRLNEDQVEELYPDLYLTLFPISIETMPILHHNPRGKFLQISTVGCNFRCGGCISETLTARMEDISGGLKKVDAESVVNKAMEENCTGIVFCVNDPVVSLRTFTSVAKKAQARGLLAGCSTNCYFTEEAIEILAPHLDFINIGFKGFTDDAYKACGAPGINPVLRNLEILHKKGVHVEVSVIYSKGREDEVLGLARHVAALSDKIPFHIMRFFPFGDASMEDEPTIYESELLCDKVRKTLPFTYLFNSPGTDRLDTICPACGSVIVNREFYGPMGARVLHYADRGECRCGNKIPFKGSFHNENFNEPGFFGGYRTTRAIEIIQSIITSLNPAGKDLVYATWSEVLKTDFLQKFHKIMQDPYSYTDLIKFLSEKTDSLERGKKLISYIENILNQFKEAPDNREKPRVYYAMGYPLFALNAERIETNLVTIAGGYCVNKEIIREGKPGVTITAEEFNAFNAEYIFISGFITCPVSDFYRYCIDNGLKCPALDNKKVFAVPSLWDFGSLRWVLGLLFIAGVLHPDRFPEDPTIEAERFYSLFYNIEYSKIRPNRSFYRVNRM